MAGQLFFAAPSLLIAAPLIWPRRKVTAPSAAADGDADAFDRRIVTLLAFGPAAAMIALTVVSGRGTVAMWGYPLWLFLGLWVVLCAPAVLDRLRLARVVGLWAIVSACFVIAFVADYLVLPGLDHRPRAVLFPGDRLAAELVRRFQAATGHPPAYVIGSMWDGGNVAHYSGEWPPPRVLIDGLPQRAPWIDLADLRLKGALVVWTAGDLNVLPEDFAAVAAGAEVGAPFVLPFRRGGSVQTVGWAILHPRVAGGNPTSSGSGS